MAVSRHVHDYAAGWAKARQLPFADFEDAVVATVAEETGLAFIITRNGDDFAGSPVPAISPADFLSQFTPPSKPRFASLTPDDWLALRSAMKCRFVAAERSWTSFCHLSAGQKESARKAWKVFRRNSFDSRMFVSLVIGTHSIYKA